MFLLILRTSGIFAHLLRSKVTGHFIYRKQGSIGHLGELHQYRTQHWAKLQVPMILYSFQSMSLLRPRREHPLLSLAHLSL